MLLTIIVLVLTIGILVIIHEWGHYITAKRFGIKVLEFGFGLPPRAWGKKIGETIWSINWLPFGGFVHLLGEDEVDKTVLKDPRSFSNQPVIKRIIVVAAGVIMNLLLAWVLFYILLGMQGFKSQIQLVKPFNFVGVHQTNESVVFVSRVADGSPAQQAGLQPGERIIALNDQFIADSTQFVTSTKQYLGQTVKLTVSDAARTKYRVVELTPRANPPAGQGAIGLSLAPANFAILEYREPWQKLLAGPIHGYNLTVYSFEMLGSSFGASLAKKDASLSDVRDNVAGPIGIGYYLNSILESKDISQLLAFVAVISLNLAIFNVFPIPGLDGGRLAFLLYEAITRRKPNATVEKYIHSVGLSLLLILIFLISAQDINRFVLHH